MENGESRENKPFHQHRVKYNGYEAQIKYPYNAALACYCIKLAVARSLRLGCRPNFADPPDLMPKKDRKFISSRVRPTFGPRVREINRMLKLYGGP